MPAGSVFIVVPFCPGAGELFEVTFALFGFAAADDAAELKDYRVADRVDHRRAIAATIADERNYLKLAA